MLNRTRFRRRLLDWFRRSARDLPWRRTRDPYAIWVSEVMLQQTRVEAAIPYYRRFLARFPDVASLAAAREQDVLAAWAGLGYYSRARKLQAAARRIVEDGGAFPNTLAALRALPGIGDYTAAAVGSIVFDLPHAAVDGNVLRVLARISADTGSIKAPATRKRLGALAQECLDRRAPGAFNEAMMELGATVCTPREPRCPLCPVAADCEARAAGRQRELPVTGARDEREIVRSAVYLVERDGQVLLKQRAAGERRMAGFWELPDGLPDTGSAATVGEVRHSIVNQDHRVEVRIARLSRAPRGHRWWPVSRLDEIPLTTITKKALAHRRRQTSEEKQRS